MSALGGLAGILALAAKATPIVIDTLPLAIAAVELLAKWFKLLVKDKVTPDDVADLQQAVNSFQLAADKFPIIADSFTSQWMAERDKDLKEKADAGKGTGS